MMNNMKLPPGVMPQDKADNIPAKLSPGEYVIPAEVVRRKGTEFFDKLVDSGKKDLNQAAQQGRIGGTPQMPQQQQRPAPQMKFMQQGQPKPPQMQQMQQRGPMAQMQQRPAPMTQQGQPQRLPMAHGGFVAGPQAGNQAYHAGPQMGNYANGGQVNYPQGYNPYQNPGPYQFYPYQLGPQAWGGYPGPHVNPNFYDYTVRRNTQPEKKDEVEGKRASDLRPGETEDGKMVGTNTDYDVAIANMKGQGHGPGEVGANTFDYKDVDPAVAMDFAMDRGITPETLSDAVSKGEISKDQAVSMAGMAQTHGGASGKEAAKSGAVPGALGFFSGLRDAITNPNPTVSKVTGPTYNNSLQDYIDATKEEIAKEIAEEENAIAGEGTDTSDSSNEGGGYGTGGEGGSGIGGHGESQLADGGLVVPPAVQAFRRK